MSKYAVLFGPYFPVFGLNTDIYAAIHHFHSGYRKVRTRKNSVFGRFSWSVNHTFHTFFLFYYNIVKIRSASRIIFDYNILGDSQKYMTPILVASSAKRGLSQILVIVNLNGREDLVLKGCVLIWSSPANNYLFKVSNWSTGTRCGSHSRLIMKILESQLVSL